MSRPLSTIVVQTSTSYSRSQKSSTTRSRRPSSICPCATPMRVGDELAQLLAHVVDVLHTVVDEEDLALAQQLPPDRLGRGTLVELAHVREDGLAVLGRRVHEGEIPGAGERHLERARVRCRGRGEP